jgi:hypothetical protein
MRLQDFTSMVTNFGALSHAEKIKHLGWYLHTHKNKERFDQADIRICYDELHYVRPTNVSAYFQQLQQRNPPELLKDARGYRLEGRTRQSLDSKYGQRPASVILEKSLADLPGKIPDEAERLFLTEALNCYRVKAFRAAIVMTWNVAYDHFEQWIINNHLGVFNARIAINYPSLRSVVITKKEDFGDHLKESQTIEIAKSAGLISDNVKKILSEKLVKRNMAAHPSLVAIEQYQADDVISDLVNNVILKLV